MKLPGGRSLEGAGLQAMAWSTLKSLSPYHWNQKVKQYRKNVSTVSSLNDYEKDMATLAKHSYGDVENRSHHKNYMYQKELSGSNYSVYRNEDTNKNYLVFKGTSTKEDILPDAAILTGYQNLNQSFADANSLYNSLSPQLKGTWETVGHSLGGTKAMYVAQQNNITSHAFNPGYNNYADDQIDTTYKNHNVYVKQGDPISNSILTEEIANLKVLPTEGMSPLANHTIDNF